MNENAVQKIGFVCAYTPLPLIHAAGYVPLRVLPMSQVPDQAGHLLHDNLCPHVKRVLDRALGQDLPELAAMVFINSCDAMRRLADAWQTARSNDRVILLDLPTTADDRSTRFFAEELVRFTSSLSDWSGRPITAEKIAASIEKYNALAQLLADLSNRMQQGQLAGGSAGMQKLFNQAASQSVEYSLERLTTIAAEPGSTAAAESGVPVFLFGNVLPDPEAFALFESCGARIIGDDLCTGLRQFTQVTAPKGESVFLQLAQSILQQPPCARTFVPRQPGKIAVDVLDRAKACGARGVIGHTLKFCDPYLARLPFVRETLKEANLPLLLLEGDCTLRSMGQQRTRIEAFIEMLR